ncbi:MAG TPA: HAMP domain-containing sensor histidine kinase [Solirubrobacteraceae bacterium]|jgi:signal transduction histidine kinase
MRGIALRPERPWWRRYRLELVWVAFAAANYGAIIVWPLWKVIPFHFVWISLTLLYGFQVWPMRPTLLVLGCVMVASGAALLLGRFSGALLWSELLAVPLMAAMFLAMVWHARRHIDAQRVVEQRAEAHRSLLASQERFVHDASHELRTPVTIARGHLELLRGRLGHTPEIEVALDELSRIDAITARLLLLATIDQPDFVQPFEIELEPVLEEVFMRWSEAAPRSWRLGALAEGSLMVDPERLRVALDALIENAVKYSEPAAVIELSARREGGAGVSIEVHDEGRGVPAESLNRIFERFARADLARTRAAGGAGLGLAIVDAIVKAHGGTATVANTPHGPTFALHMPRFRPASVPTVPVLGIADADLVP